MQCYPFFVFSGIKIFWEWALKGFHRVVKIYLSSDSSQNIKINIFFATSTYWLLLGQEMNINNLIALTPAFHFILQTNLEFPWLLYLWRLARNLEMHLKMIWIKYSIETYRSCQKMTKYHQIRDERTNLESHQFLMNSCFWKRIQGKIKVVQKMNLDKTLKTHQINPLSYISVDDFGDNSHKCKGNLRSQAAR